MSPHRRSTCSRPSWTPRWRDRRGYDAGSDWLAYESPAEAILTEAANAELVVLGSRVHHRLQAAVLGSVVTSVTARATCPVVVVRGEAHDGPILVGTDGSEDSQEALEFAFEEASRSHASLSVVYCWQPWQRHEQAVEDAAALLRGWLAESLEPIRARFSDVAVEAEVVDGRPSPWRSAPSARHWLSWVRAGAAESAACFSVRSVRVCSTTRPARSRWSGTGRRNDED